MAKAKKTKASVNDVARPDTTAPSDTSRPIITHRPMMKDPMVVEDEAEQPDSAKTAEASLSHKSEELKIIPTEGKEAPAPAEETPKKTKTETLPEPEPKKVTVASSDEPAPGEADLPVSETKKAEKEEADKNPPSTDNGEATAPDKKTKKPGQTTEDAAKAAEEAKLQKLIDSKKYTLPINQVEQRRSKRFVAAGVLLAIVLIVAWADIALDAGLVQIDNVKPVTHFFSN